MSDPAQIEQEIREYLSIEKNLATDDRLQYLMAIFNKHFAIDKIGHTIVHGDIVDMISKAKSAWPNTIMPVEISRKEIKGVDVSYILIIESFINHLNRNNLLKRLVKFDYSRRRE